VFLLLPQHFPPGTCSALHAKYQHLPNDALREAQAARSDPALACPAAYLMADIYLQPAFEAVWSGSQLAATVAAAAVQGCDDVLLALPQAEQQTIKWQVRVAVS
jgi:hypothetical protein